MHARFHRRMGGSGMPNDTMIHMPGQLKRRVTKTQARISEKPLTPRALRLKIKSLPPAPPITAAFERALRKAGILDVSKAWYQTQHEHWLGWLREYDGPGYYGRRKWDRSAEFVYNHIVCPPMVLWLGEAVGVPASVVRKARKSALTTKPTLPAMSTAIRKVIPWFLIEPHLREIQPR